MKPSRMFLVAVLAATLLFAGATPASAATLARRVRTLESRVASLRKAVALHTSRINTLSARVTSLMTSRTSMETRVTSLEDSRTAESAFWPVDDLVVSPTLTAQPDDMEPERDSELVIELRPSIAGTDMPATACEPQAVMKVSVGGEVFWGTGPRMEPEWLTASRPAAGTPVQVEYWLEAYGQRVHATETFTGWSWTTP